MSREQDYFNCSEEHEFTYVSGLYEEKAAVKTWLKEKCEDGTICYTKHKDLYKMLDDAGYTRK